jgi:hypothetical protein
MDIDNLGDLQDETNRIAKELLKKRYPHISPDWYHIEFRPSHRWKVCCLGGSAVVRICMSIPPNDPDFIPALIRNVRLVPSLRKPLSVEKYAMVEGLHHEHKRIGYRRESDLFAHLLLDVEVEYRVITRVECKHLASGTIVSVESETDPSNTLKSRALLSLSHKINGK